MLTHYLTRSALLRGRLQSSKPPRRPPWAVDEAAFALACTPACENACVDACPERILVSAAGGRPEIRFERGECTFCAACVEVCPSGALTLENADGAKRQPWALRAIVTNRCLAIAGVTCRACGEACAEEAIDFKLGLNGKAFPTIDDALCTGCGGCVRPCPVGAVCLEDPSQGAERAV